MTRASFARRLLRSPVAVGAILFLVLLVAVSLAAPLVAPYAPGEQDLTNALSGPTSSHPLGADTVGRDVLSRLIYAGRTSLVSVLEALAVVLVVGVPLGLIAGYAGGWTDRVLSRFAETLMAIPAIVLILVVLAVFPQNTHAAMATFGLLGTPMVLRVVRGATLRVREELYVTAARVSGLSHLQIVLRHVVPRVRGAIIVQASIFAAYALLFETGLAFLGLTADPTTPTWGGMVAEASTVIQQQAWLMVPSGTWIAVTILALGLLGDAVRDAAVIETVTTESERTHDKRRSYGAPAASAAPAASDALLQVTNLSIAADVGGHQTPIVDKVGFEVTEAETLGLVGESGCGKSVTALALLRLLPASLRAVEGSALWHGRDLVRLPDHAYDELRGSALGYVSQEPQASLDPTFTVASQLVEVVRRHDPMPRSAAKARALELLTLVELPDPEQTARSHAHELSGGMAQRVAMALALAARPRLLIADEPTTALDVTVQAEFLALLRRLQIETGMAILLITHDWGVVADICDRIAVMYAGQIVEQGGAQEMFDRPLHPYTAGLLASSPSTAEPGQRLPSMPGRVPVPGAWPHGCRFAPRCPLASDACGRSPIPYRELDEHRLSRCIHAERVSREVSVH